MSFFSLLQIELHTSGIYICTGIKTYIVSPATNDCMSLIFRFDSLPLYLSYFRSLLVERLRPHIIQNHSCQGVFFTGIRLFGCRKCDFDLCETCLQASGRDYSQVIAILLY